jgi:hypothetical protein
MKMIIAVFVPIVSINCVEDEILCQEIKVMAQYPIFKR